MPTIPRNAPCPCGSGRKHKLCCGTTRDQERAQRTAFEDLFALPASFPLLRPDSDDFEDWLSAHRDEPPIRTLLEEGIETLGERECERIARSYSRWYPKRWASLVVAVPDEAAAETIVVVGAIGVAFAEERLPDELVLEYLEDDPRLVAPADALSLCLEATDFWSVVEAVAADVVVAAIPDELDDDEYTRQRQAALTREATRLLTRGHRRRLSLLVGRLARELPIEGFPRASNTLAVACAAFERDRRMRSRVAAMLLGDALRQLPPHELRLAA